MEARQLEQEWERPDTKEYWAVSEKDYLEFLLQSLALSEES